MQVGTGLSMNLGRVWLSKMILRYHTQVCGRIGRDEMMFRWQVGVLFSKSPFFFSKFIHEQGLIFNPLHGGSYLSTSSFPRANNVGPSFYFPSRIFGRIYRIQAFVVFLRLYCNQHLLCWPKVLCTLCGQDVTWCRRLHNNTFTRLRCCYWCNRSLWVVLTVLCIFVGKWTFLIKTHIIAFVNYAGVGYHFATILLRAPTKPLLLLKISYIFAVINCFSVMFPKLAMLCFFLRIFIERWHRVACYILMGVLFATAIATLAANLAQCIPLKVLWGTTEAAEKCINQQLLWALSSLPNIITDLIMLALPVPVIWKIQLSWKDKVGLMLTFGTGSM